MRSLITILFLSFLISSEAQNISQSQVRQFNAVSAYRVFGRGAGVGTPSFLQLDSNWIPSLHSVGYYDSRYNPKSIGDSSSYHTATSINDSTASFNRLNGTKTVVRIIGGSTSTGTLSAGSIAWPGTLYTTPTTGVVSGSAITFSPTLTSQSAYTALARGSGSGTPSFTSVSSWDSTWNTLWHSLAFLDARYAAFGSGGGTTVPGGSTTQVQYNNAGAFAGSSNLTWDNTNKRLGIGSTSPAVLLDMAYTGTASDQIKITNTGTGNFRNAIDFFNSTNAPAIFGINSVGATPYGALAAGDVVIYGGSDFTFMSDNGHSMKFATGATPASEKMRLPSSGNLLLGTTSDDATNKLQVNGTAKATQFKVSALNTAPTSATDTGTLGEIRITAGFIYVCIATNTWVRTTLTTF